MIQNQHIRSFGRVKGHKLSILQNSLIDDFLPKIKPDISKLSKRIWFEIGFGAGEHLIQLIDERKNQDITIIGCEPYINGAIKPIKYIYDNSCKNVYISDEDARKLIETLPDCLVEKFFILFPDPWPKKRHHKRRIINKFILAMLFSKLSENGVITIATDHIGYAQWIAEVLDQHNYKHSVLNSADECKESGILTRYCQKALSRNNVINLFIVTK